MFPKTRVGLIFIVIAIFAIFVTPAYAAGGNGNGNGAEKSAGVYNYKDSYNATHQISDCSYYTIDVEWSGHSSNPNNTKYNGNMRWQYTETHVNCLGEVYVEVESGHYTIVCDWDACRNTSFVREETSSGRKFRSIFVWQEDHYVVGHMWVDGEKIR